jgi:hypothetical protein
MKSTVCPNDKNESNITHQCYQIHDTKWGGNPDVSKLQAWDPCQEESGWEAVITDVGS